jgi:hypothetical protein
VGAIKQAFVTLGESTREDVQPEVYVAAVGKRCDQEATGPEHFPKLPEQAPRIAQVLQDVRAKDIVK